MGRTTSIIISKNPHTKTQQTQTIWFGDGEIRLNGETGTYIGEYAKDGGWWLAEVNFAGEAPIERAQSGGSWVGVYRDADGQMYRAKYSVQTVSPPLTTATQAAQAVAWAWLACKALEGLAAAAAPVLEVMEQEESEREAAEVAARNAEAEATWQQYRANGSWWHIVTAKNNYLVFNAAEERAFYTTPQGELFREVEAKEEVNFALTCWNSPTIYPYVGEVWAHYFRANSALFFKSHRYSFGDNVELFRKAIAFDELETPEQVYAWLTISEADSYAAISDSVKQVEFRWKLSFRAHAADFCDFLADEGEAHLYYENARARPEEQRTIIADCK